MYHFQGFFKGKVKTTNNCNQIARDTKIGSIYLGEGIEITVTSKKPQRKGRGLYSLPIPRVGF